MIVLGIFFLRLAIKNPSLKKSAFGYYTKGIIAGVWFILMGIIVIIARFLGKL